MKIGVQLIISFIVISLSITVIGYVYTLLMQDTFEEKIAENATLLAIETMHETDQRMHDRIMELFSFSDDARISSYIIESNQEFQKINDVEEYIKRIDRAWIKGDKIPEIDSILTNELSIILKNKVSSLEEDFGYALFPEIFVMNKHGVVIGSSGKTSDYDQSDDSWYPKDFTERKYWVYDVEYDETADAVVAGVVIPIDYESQVIGAMKGYIDMNSDVTRLLNYVESQSSYDTMSINIVDKDGFSVFSQSGIEYDTDKSLNVFGVPSESFGVLKKAGVSEKTGYVFDKKEEQSILAAYAVSEGYQTYEGLNWCTIIDYDAQELFGPLEELKMTLLSISFGITLVGALFGIIITRKISSPIKKLESATHSISQGNMKVDVPIEGTDEHKSLARSFNKMTRSIEKSEEVISEQLNELKKLDKQKSDFSAMVSHELKSPLNPILGYCELLLRKLGDDGEEQQVKMIKKIQNNAMKLEKLIDRIFLAQKIELKNINIQKTAFSVNEFFEEIINDFKSNLKKKNIMLFTNLSGKISIFSDKDKIHEIFSNLIQNSIDFVDSDSGKIEIGAQQKDNDIIFYVKDNGVGISIEHQSNLFKKYYQIDTSITREHGGSGLGLSICKGLVDAMNGKIWVDSNLNEGATFYFSIPMK